MVFMVYCFRVFKVYGCVNVFEHLDGSWFSFRLLDRVVCLLILCDDAWLHVAGGAECSGAVSESTSLRVWLEFWFILLLSCHPKGRAL